MYVRDPTIITLIIQSFSKRPQNLIVDNKYIFITKVLLVFQISNKNFYDDLS